MLVKLTQTKLEGHGVKISLRKQPRRSVAFVEGAVVEMSEASAQKYIDQGLAVKYEPAAEEKQA